MNGKRCLFRLYVFSHRREKNGISEISHDFEKHFDIIFRSKGIYNLQYIILARTQPRISLS